MITKLMMNIYRTGAILIALSPITLNIILNGDILVSLLYAPFLSLALAILAIAVDSKLQKENNQKKSKAKRQIFTYYHI